VHHTQAKRRVRQRRAQRCGEHRSGHEGRTLARDARDLLAEAHARDGVKRGVDVIEGEQIKV
jgi:hypothetical protein